MANSRTVGDASQQYAKLEKILEGVGRASEGQVKRTKKLNASMIKMGVTLKEQGKSWKDLGLQTKLVTKAFKGHTASVAKATNAYKKFQQQQKVVGSAAVEAGGWTRNLRNKFGGLNNEVDKGTTSWAKYGRKLSIVRSRLLIVAFAARVVQKTIVALIKLNEQQILVELKLSRVLQSTGYAAGITGLKLREMASALSKTSLIADEVIIDAQAIMLTFTKIGKDVFPEAIKQSLNLSLVFSQDLQQSIIQVGKALNEPITGVGRLAKIGVSFSNTQREQIKNFMEMNDIASAQGVILEELAMETGNLAEAMIDTPMSGWKQAWMDLKDSGEGLGSLLSFLLTPLERVAEATGKLALAIDFLDNKWTNRDSRKAMIERDQIIKSFNDSIRAQLRLFKEFTPKGTTGEASKQLRIFIGLYKLGIMNGEEFIEASRQLIETQRELAIAGGFVVDSLFTEMELRRQNIALLGIEAQELRTKKDLYDSLMTSVVDLGELEINKWNKKEMSKLDVERKRINETVRSEKSKRDQLAIIDEQIEAQEKKHHNKMITIKLLGLAAETTMAIGGIKANMALAEAKAVARLGLLLAAPVILAIEALQAQQIGATVASNAAAGAVLMASYAAKGADFTTTGPQMMMVGDNPGGRERVQVTPLSSPNIAGPQGGAVTVNVSGNVLSQDFVEGELAENIKEAIRRGTDFGIS